MDKIVIELTDNTEGRRVGYISNVPLPGGEITYALKGRVPQLDFTRQVAIVEVRGEIQMEAPAWIKAVKTLDPLKQFDYELTVVTTEHFKPCKT